jgi:hypothetical protein
MNFNVIKITKDIHFIKNKNILYNYMATTSNYTFYNLSRIGDDNCGISGRDMQNNDIGNYLTTNHYEKWCGMKHPIDFATQQPNVNFSGGHGGIGGCTIENNSKLKMGSIQTRPKCRISLYQRPFATVPFLGRGPPRPVVESRIQQGAWMSDTKSCKTIMEKSFEQHTTTPLVPTLAATIQNPANLVEGIAADGWIRGGLPSRELTRNRDYLERN